jgi:hypothetical protein
LDVSEGKKNQHQGKEAMPSSDVVMASSAPSLSTSLDVNAFLALLHGNELQTWVRSARYRWNKICKMRGLFSFLAEDKKRSAFTAVLSTGHTLKMIVLSWRKLAPKSAKKNSGMSERRKRKDMTQNVQDASIDESKRVADSSRSSLPGGTVNSEHDECAEGRLVSEALVNSGASATEILQESRPAELFYESRVASAERLVAWFVLLHAMAKPSSLLPFLSFELGKSESRLRVASTPAPVPFSGFEAGQAEATDSEGSIVEIAQPTIIFDGEETVGTV